MKLGDLIIDYRNRNDLSQREFACRADLSNSLISIIEKGVNPQTGKEISPDIDTYMKIALAMGIDLHTLFEKLGNDAPVTLTSFHSDTEPDRDYIPEDKDYIPKNDDVRLLIKGLNKLSPEQLEQAKNVMRAMFIQYEDYFKENDDDPEL